MNSASTLSNYRSVQNVGNPLFKYVNKKYEMICSRIGVTRWFCSVKSRRPALIRTDRKQTQSVVQKISRRSLLPLLLAALIVAGIPGDIILAGAEAAESNYGHETGSEDPEAPAISDLSAAPAQPPASLPYAGNIGIFSGFNYAVILLGYFLLIVIGFECLGRFINLYSLKHHK